MGASVVARARERRYVRVGGGTSAGDVVGLGRDLADQPGAHVLDGVLSSTSLATATSSLAISGAPAPVVEEL